MNLSFVHRLRNAYARLRCTPKLVGLAVVAACVTAAPASAQQDNDPQQQSSQQTAPADPSNAQVPSPSVNGPVQLRQPATLPNNTNRPDTRGATYAPPPAPYVPGEFELFVQNSALTTQTIRRFGVELISDAASAAPDFAPQVPSDYQISVGDEIVINIWGSVDANLRLTVDRTGRINLPRVGAVMVAGVRYADLPGVVTRAVSQVFRNFEVSVSLGQLRSIRIYLTGFTSRPGSYTVSSLSTIVNALMRTGGPSAAGTFRSIQLIRDGKTISNFDLYDLLLRGDKSADKTLQAEDVLYIGPVGPQVAMIGSVNKPAIFELKPGDSVSEVINMAGGFTAVADRSRLAVEWLSDRNSVRVSELALPADAQRRPAAGDILRALSQVSSILPVQRQNKRIRVEGEVVRPGEYVMPAGATIDDALRAAGGTTASAFIFGTEFNRESARLQQQQNYDRALRDLETETARASASQHALTADEAAAQAARAASGSRLIERLRAIKPTGRIVLQLTPSSTELPNMPLEEGDRLYVPPKPTTVGVFGSVYNPGSFLYMDDRNVSEYLNLAGGYTRGADSDYTFVVRANGSVVSERQSRRWFHQDADLSMVPGDTVFVPEEFDKTTFVQAAKEWTQILYQFGIGAAALITISK